MFCVERKQQDPIRGTVWAMVGTFPSRREARERVEYYRSLFHKRAMRVRKLS